MKRFFGSAAGMTITVLLLLAVLAALGIKLGGVGMEDRKPPEFFGVEDMKVEKYTRPDYEYGVRAIDGKEGIVEFAYNVASVDITSAGTYYIIYTASDSKGNTASYRRKVEVIPDDGDRTALIASIAEDLEDSAEEIRDYVRSSISYSSSWGGDDPLWYGLQNKTGNCYVHAVVLDAMLRIKGFTTQMIWCEDKTHYWNLVYLEGSWKHIDSTPSQHTHSKYSLMNDEQRYETLSGRDWDRTAWPICP